MKLQEFVEKKEVKTLQDLAEAIENGKIELTEQQEELIEKLFDDIGYDRLPYVELDEEAEINVVVKNVTESGDVEKANLYFMENGGVEWGTFRDILSTTNSVDDLIDDFLTNVDPIVRIDLDDEQKEIVNNSEKLMEIFIKDTGTGIVPNEKLLLNIFKKDDNYYLYAMGRAPVEDYVDAETYDEELFTKIDAPTALKYIKKLEKIDKDDDLYGEDYIREMVRLSEEIMSEFPNLYNLNIYLYDETFLEDSYGNERLPKTVEYEYDSDALKELEKQIEKESKQKTQPKKNKKQKNISGPGF